MYKDKTVTWKQIIIFSILAGIYTAIMCIIPAIKSTSFHDIAVTFEVWILFGILIIMHSKSAKDSALKCFVFFLISQPLVYLIQVPFSSEGLGIFRYYKYWFMMTLFTLPMGYIGYYLKKDKWYGLLILTPILLLLGSEYYSYLRETLFHFPYHLLTSLFCIVSLLLYPIFIFKNKKIKAVGTSIGIVISVVFTIMVFMNPYVYNTSILISDDDKQIIFDDTYNIHLENENIGEVYINYDEGIETYVVNASFTHAGTTKLILEDANGNQTIFNLTVDNTTYELDGEA